MINIKAPVYVDLYKSLEDLLHVRCSQQIFSKKVLFV